MSMDVPGRPGCTWKAQMYLEGLDVPGRPRCTWKAWMYLEGLDVLGRPRCTWKAIKKPLCLHNGFGFKN